MSYSQYSVEQESNKVSTPARKALISLPLWRAAVSMLVAPVFWLIVDTRYVLSHPEVVTALFSVTLSVLRWRMSIGGLRDNLKRPVTWDQSSTFTLMVLLYILLFIGTVYYGLELLPFLSPFKLGPSLLTFVLLVNFMYLFVMEFFSFKGTESERYDGFKRHFLRREKENRGPIGIALVKNRSRFRFCLGVTWVFFLIYGLGYSLTGIGGWAILFTGLGIWVTYLEFAQRWVNERISLAEREITDPSLVRRNTGQLER